MGFQDIHQVVVSAEVILPRRLFSRLPCEIHAGPAGSGSRKHFHLPGFRVEEVNIHPDAVRNDSVESDRSANTSRG